MFGDAVPRGKIIWDKFATSQYDKAILRFLDKYSENPTNTDDIIEQIDVVYKMPYTTVGVDDWNKVAAINRHRVAHLWDDIALLGKVPIIKADEFEPTIQLDALKLILKEMLTLTNDNDQAVEDMINTVGFKFDEDFQKRTIDYSIADGAGYKNRYPVQLNSDGVYELVDPEACPILYYDAAALLKQLRKKMPLTTLSDDEIKSISEINEYRVAVLWNQAIVNNLPDTRSTEADQVKRVAALDEVLLEMFSADGDTNTANVDNFKDGDYVFVNDIIQNPQQDFVDQYLRAYIAKYPIVQKKEIWKLYPTDRSGTPNTAPDATAPTGFLARLNSASTLSDEQWTLIKEINDDRLSDDDSLWTDFFTNNK